MKKTYSMELAGRTLSVDIGRVAAQANGAALMHYGDTVVLSTATASEREPEGSSFQKRSSENGWSETWYACLPSEKRSGRLSGTDRKIRHQKIITG